jgi:HD-like signal output (HDOD) protein
MQVAAVWNRSKCPPALSLARFNKHAAAVAMLSDLLAQRVPVEYPEGAFVAGLLHDVGRMLIAVGLPKEFTEMAETHARVGTPLNICEMSALGCTHAGLSEWALRQWNLPAPLQSAVGRHHDDCGPSGGPATLGSIVAAADHYVSHAGYSTFPAPSQSASLEPLQALGLDLARAEETVSAFQRDFEAASRFFH